MEFTWLVVLAALITAIGVLVWLRSNSAPRECKGCVHWDLEEGQEAIKQFPEFLRAAMHIPMSQMSMPIVGHDAAGDPIYGKPGVPAKARWEHVGACMCPAPSARDEEGDPVLRWAGDTCQHHKRARGKRQLPLLGATQGSRPT